jgi:DNA polymerase elongation subunit (family B)
VKRIIFEFMKFWIKNHPDVITGWNTKFFDLPYLMNRIKLVADEESANRMSPWKIAIEREINVQGRTTNSIMTVWYSNVRLP